MRNKSKVSAASLRVGIIGCGQIADGHAMELYHTENATLVAVCDRELEMAQQLAVRYDNPKVYLSAIEMLRESSLDVVHICTPPGSHLELGLLCMENGCHVLIEKPLAKDYSEACQLIEAAIRLDRKLTIGHIYDFDPVSIKAKSIVQSKAIGDVVHMDCSFGYDLSGSFGKAMRRGNWISLMPGGLLKNNVNHLFSRAANYFDTTLEPTVQAKTWRSDHIPDGIDLHDELRVSLKCGNVTANCVFTTAHQHQTLILYGTEGIIFADFLDRKVLKLKKGKLPSAVGRLIDSLAIVPESILSAYRNISLFARSDYRFFVGMGNLFQQFYEAILEDTAVPLPYSHILFVEQIVANSLQEAKP